MSLKNRDKSGVVARIKDIVPCGGYFEDSEPPFVITQDALYFIDGVDLKRVDFTTAKMVHTVKKRILSSKHPTCISAEYDHTAGTLTVQVGALEGSERPHVVSSKDYKFKVPDAPVEIAARAKPISSSTLCEWTAGVGQRSATRLRERRGKLYLEIQYPKSNAGATKEEFLVGDLWRYQDCIKESSGENDFGIDCEDFRTQLDCRHIKGKPVARCDVFTTVEDDDNFRTVWIYESKGKTILESSRHRARSNYLLSPSGCWQFIDGQPVGPTGTHAQLRELELIQWIGTSQ